MGVGAWGEVREAYADYLIELIAESYLPELRRRMLARTVHSPLDIERKLSSAVRGTIPHGAMVPYQSGAMRPTPDFAGYRSPVENVYLCGSGSYPGAGVSMAPGRNAARDLRKWRCPDFLRHVVAPALAPAGADRVIFRDG